MDNVPAPSSRELAQQLYEKNIELENKRRKSVQARIPSDPNTWQQLRENFEAIILKDHAFSEQHNIEYALWRLHYKRIEELRAHINAALASVGSPTTHGRKAVPARPDRITKIRLQLKTFLSEATGFYHDLNLKIRAHYGLPLGYFPEESQVIEKGGNKSNEAKPGLVSCHRCLIYLGDLARYKGLYADSDSKSRDFTAASSYYLQAASVWPSSGNPHHQLAILASYSGDELLAVYRYFRSLAVEIPFSTARDNLIVVFEKNRKSYSLLVGESKASAVVNPLTPKGKGKEETKSLLKEDTNEASRAKERVSNIHEAYKSFCTQVVRLNGILFTRTSLETFAEVLASHRNLLCELLSSGLEEEFNFGSNAVENGNFIIRLVSILIFTAHIVNKETENQSYADILQRTVLVQNAYVAVFDFMGQIMKRCLQLREPSSSFLLPGILVFVEWLACCPDVSSGPGNMDEQQATIRSLFWNHCISFSNKLLSGSLVSVDDEGDESCFYNTSKYEGETGNRMALWEDFELRGFLPLLPAQSILDFSRKNSFNSDEKARVKRFLAAVKLLSNVVTINKNTIRFDSNKKRFIIGPEMPEGKPGMIKSNGVTQEKQTVKNIHTEIVHSYEQLIVEGGEDDEEEEIVFKPTLNEKRTDTVAARWAPPDQSSAEVINTSESSLLPPFPQRVSNWGPEQQAYFANGLKGLNLMGNGQVTNNGISQAYPDSHSIFPGQSSNLDARRMFYDHAKLPENIAPSLGVQAGNLAATTSLALPLISRQNPVVRPVRHLGPPPGFTRLPVTHTKEPVSTFDPMSGNQLNDDYSWLDGYKQPSSKDIVVNNPNSYVVANDNIMPGTVNFPFSGRQIPRGVQFQMETQNGMQLHHQPVEHLKHEQQMQYQPPLAITPHQADQYHVNNVWKGPHFV